MINIIQGDRGPRVITLQYMLRQLSILLTVDGFFGRETIEAVRQFQSSFSIEVTGVVNGSTWLRLCSENNLVSLDANDIYDYQHHTHTPADMFENNIIETGGMSGGVGNVLHHIIDRVGTRQIGLLRFFGHGHDGLQGMSGGSGSLREMDNTEMVYDPTNPLHTVYSQYRIDSSGHIRVPYTQEHTALGPETIEYYRPLFNQLRNHMSNAGSVEFHGCHVGRGAGRVFLQDIANLLQVPTTAGIDFQVYGGERSYRFEGDVTIRYPGNASQDSWAGRMRAS